jgi:3-methylcrotonyl-CoA carboxylase alpha subunit
MRVAICNRGEVAVRVIRACQELGYKSILLHSTPDRNTVAYRLADETVELEGSAPLETYLNISKVIEAAQSAKATMLHPGFGFLSENADFVEKLEATEIIFVGPKSKSIRLAGNKIRAKEMAIKAGVPVTQAYTGVESDPLKLLEEAKKIGFPCIVKAASGGGGKGMKVVRHAKDFIELLASAQREALNAFGDTTVFIEKYLENPRHIEVQILCDSFGKKLHFFERDCTIQRRHQKVFEETPALILSKELRDKITSAALKLAEACEYENAGTVEFLLDSKNNFYFMELNTRLQVEHTVTELVCGIDLVKLQFKVALKKKISLAQKDISQHGHALEVRIYAENPDQQFLPSTGEILILELPQGPFRRFDFGYGMGDEITPFYDPMIGKIITWAQTREENLERMHATLCETVVFGVHTNIEFLKAVLKNEKYMRQEVSTSFLETHFLEGFKTSELSQNQLNALKKAQSTSFVKGSAFNRTASLKYQSPWIKN